MTASLSPAQFKVRDRLLEDVSDLPVLPNAAARLLGLDPGSDDYFEAVVETVLQDPGLSVKVLAIANSAAVSGVARVRTIPDAIFRLGARGVSNLILTMGVVGAFPPRQGFEDALWRHSFEVAHVSRALARALRDKTVTPEEAYLVGLLHDIGRFLLAREAVDARMLDGEGAFEDPGALLLLETEVCGVHHAELGAIACDQWSIPIEISRVVRCHHHADAELPAEFLRAVQVLRVADGLVAKLLVGKSTPAESLETKALGRMLEAVWPAWSKSDPWDQVETVREALATSRKVADAIGLRY